MTHATSPTNTRTNARLAQRWLAGVAVVVLLALIALFIYGIVSGSAPLMVSASSGAAVVGAAWAAGYVTIKKRNDSAV
ncbi:hypothetical protein [Microbacterium sp. YY-01]|uniref:hypothetical protein n=1 Tax=Microbacterium sp. YY-01 TaxID=3421634 RepID=UPI003D176849